MAYTSINTMLGTDLVAKHYPDILESMSLSSSAAKRDNAMPGMMRVLLNKDRLDKLNLKKVQLLGYEENPYDCATDGKLTEENFISDDNFCKTMKSGVLFVFFTCEDYKTAANTFVKCNSYYEENGWKFVKDLSAYLDTENNVFVYQSDDKQASFILCPQSLQIKVMHMAASCLPRLLPWCFDGLPLNESEIELCKTLFDNNTKKHKELMAAIYDKQNFYAKELAMAFDKFCNVDIENDINRKQREIKNNEKSIDDLLRRINDHRRAIDDIMAQIDRMYYSSRRGPLMEKEIIEFLSTNKAIRVLKRDGSSVYLGISCYLDDFDEDLFDSYVINSRHKGDATAYHKSPYSYEKTRAIFKAIWGDRRFNLRTYAGWVLHDNCTVEAMGNFNASNYGYNAYVQNRIPHPHLVWYTCYTGYRTALNDAANNHDYIGAMNLLLSSNHSINWSDSTVVNRMMGWLFVDHHDSPVFEDKDGVMYSMDDIAAIIENEMKK